MSRRSIKYFIYIPVAIVSGMFCSCVNDVKEVNEIAHDPHQPIQEGRNVEILYSKDGDVEFKLNAPLLNRYEGEQPYNEMPEGVSVEIYDSLNNVSTSLTSNYAIDRSYEQVMEARDDVVVINAKGEKLNTEKLIWNQKTGMITSDVFVKITKENQIIMGNGLESNQDFSRYKIKDISGIININE